MRLRARGLFLTVLAMAGMQADVRAADWYLQANQVQHWNYASDWRSAPEGGTQATSMVSTDNYTSVGCLVRTPTAMPYTFGGGTLTLRGATIGVKATTTTSPTVIGNLVSYGGNIGNWISNTLPVNITQFANHAHTKLDSNGATRGLDFTIGTLSGDGDLSLGGDGIVLIGITSSSNFYGRMYTLGSTSVTFKSALVSRGPLIIEGTGPVKVDANVTFNGLVINGAVKPMGTHTAQSLGFTGQGNVTVTSSQSWHLHSNTGATDQWLTPGNWWSAATGGTSAMALSSNDDYYINGFALRTPATAADAPFTGGSLIMNGGSLIVKATDGIATTSAPNFLSTGGSISNGSGNVQKLRFTSFETTGTTTLNTGASNRGFEFSSEILRGTGNLSFAGNNGGTLVVKVANANNYRGTITTSTSSTGTITFSRPFFSAGALDVKAGNAVVVNSAVTVAGLTVNGAATAAGTYLPSQVGLTGSGSVKVNNRPEHMFGVNQSGLQGDYMTIPTASQMAYYGSKGLKLIRLPFRWQRAQPILNGELDPTYIGYLDSLISTAAANGMKVILDMHNYGQYVTDSVYIGSSGVSYAAYQNAWKRLAEHFNSHPNASAIYAYDIMNEPKPGMTTWATAAQYGVNGVRESDTTRFIMIEGNSWSSAQGWPLKNQGLLGVTDPQKKIIYSAHCYFSAGGNDIYQSYDAEKAYPNLGVDKVAPFVEWCKVNNVHGHIGEYGVPKSDPRWHEVLRNFLRYLQDNDISGTCWGGGFGPSYSLSLEPTTNPVADSPLIPILQEFTQ